MNFNTAIKVIEKGGSVTYSVNGKSFYLDRHVDLLENLSFYMEQKFSSTLTMEQVRELDSARFKGVEVYCVKGGWFYEESDTTLSDAWRLDDILDINNWSRV